MKLKYYLFYFFILFFNKSQAQNSNFSISLGHNTAFRSSISNTTPSSIYTYNKNNNGGNDLISIPNINIGLNYERKLDKNFSVFIGLNSSRTETELVFENFNNTVNDGSYVKYGYSINTYEFPIGFCYMIPVVNKVILKNYIAFSLNLNRLSQGSISYRLKQSSVSDTTRLSFTEIEGFPSGNSLGIRYGIGIVPFKKFRNWEIGAYLNIQFRRSLIWDQEVEFENISQKTYEYHHAILKDKPDYLNFHIKYTFLKI